MYTNVCEKNYVNSLSKLFSSVAKWLNHFWFYAFTFNKNLKKIKELILNSLNVRHMYRHGTFYYPRYYENIGG